MVCVPESIADKRYVVPLLVFLQVLEDLVFLALRYFGKEMDACVEMPRRGSCVRRGSLSGSLMWSMVALLSSQREAQPRACSAGLFLLFQNVSLLNEKSTAYVHQTQNWNSPLNVKLEVC